MSKAEEFLEALRQSTLLDGGQLQEIVALAAQGRDVRELARELLQRNWLTAFQVNQLAKGKGHELVLDQYELCDLLGQGGMGTVYRARQRRMKRFVALKIIKPDSLQAPAAVTRFQREAEAAAKLCHPNIVTVHDANTVNGVHFLVMELVAGIDLAQLVKERGTLAVPQACDYVRQAACGLQHAHAQGIIHRDIKPANLMLAHNGLVKVMDMGLVRLHQDEQSPTLTGTGLIVGTPDFLAPEQARNARDLDARADLYSLGCTLYYLLAGRPPFGGESITEKLLQHQLEEAAPLELQRPDLPQALATFIRKLMAKDRTQRCQTAGEVIDGLEPYCQATAANVNEMVRGPVSVNLPPAPRAFSQPTVVELTAQMFRLGRRRPWLAGVASGVLLLLVGVLAWGVGLIGRPPQPPKQAASIDTDKAKACWNLGRAHLENGQYDQALAELNRALDIDPGLADAYFDRATVHYQTKQLGKALADHSAVIRLQPKNATAYFNRAVIHSARGDNELAIADYSAAIGITPGYVAALINRGSLYMESNRNDLAVIDFNAVIKVDNRNPAAYNNRGTVYLRRQEFARALKDFDQAIDLNPKNADSLYNRSLAHRKLGHPAEADADLAAARKLDPDVEKRQ